jgi:hypothetical protein
MVNIQRLTAKLKSLVSEYREKCYFFSPLDSLLFTIAPYVKRGNGRKHEAILKYLKKYADMITHRGCDLKSNIDPLAPYWVFWWQGQNNTPPIVHACIDSIYCHRGSHSVVFIDKDNLSQYADIPQHVLDKVESGVITVTHLSDIVRMSLLSQWGGYWIDATILLTKDLSDYDIPFYTMKSGVPNPRYVHGGCDWTAFFIGTGKNNMIVTFLRDFFYLYWENETHQIDYFLIDYAMELAYRKYPEFRQVINTIPSDNPDFGLMGRKLNTPFDKEEWDDLCHAQSVHKLSYKLPYKKGSIGAFVAQFSADTNYRDS